MDFEEISRTKQYWCFLGGTPWIYSMFYLRNPCKQWQIKLYQDSGHFSGCHNNIVASFAERLDLWEYERFTRGVWVTTDKVKSAIKIKTLCTLKILNIGCSAKRKILMPLSQSAQNSRTNKHGIWKWKWNENQQARFKTFSALKMMHRVLHERSNITAFSVEHQKFRERKFFSSGMSNLWQTKISD